MRILLILFLVLLTAVVSVAAVGSFYLPGYLKEKIEAEVTKQCAKCQLKIGDIDLPLFQPGNMAFHNLEFSFGEEGATQVFAKVVFVDFHISLHALLDHHVRIRHFMASHFDVTVVDGDKHSTPTPTATNATSDESEQNNFDIWIGPLRYLNGSFEYVRNHEGTTATLHVHDINGTLTTIDPKSDHVIKGELAAQYERSGQAELEVLSNPFIKPLQVDVKLTVKDQDLNDLSLFFEPNAGVRLNGKIDQGEGVISVKGDQLKATDWIVYEDLDAKVLKGKDYSGFVAFFENIGLGLAMQPKNTDIEKPEQTKSVELKQQGGESLVSFILRGLKEAAMKVATRSNR